MEKITKESEKSLLVIGVGGAGETIVGRLAKAHAEAGVRFVVGPSEPAMLERAAGVVVVLGLGGVEGGPRALLEVTRAKARGLPTTVLAIFPFTFEGRRRRRQAQETILALRATADAVRVFENDALLRSGYESLDLQGAYLKRDERLWEIIVSKVPPGTGDCAREHLPS